MRLNILLLASLLMLSSCSLVRTAMTTTMDVITAPYHYVFDEEDEDDVWHD